MNLSELTTMRVGGPARDLARAGSQQELVDAALAAWGDDDEWLVLGGGSNVVVSDDGFDGTVILVESRGIERLPSDPGTVRLRVQAGENWDALVAHTVENGWSGIEALSGIPGSAGAAPMQNIGAYGQDLAQTLVTIDFLDYLSGEVERVTAAELGFGYRTSSLKRGRQGVVLAIELELTESSETIAAYDQLAKALGVEVGDRVSSADVRASVLSLRASKGMVLDASDPDTFSCGSFFTNPIVPENVARSLPTDAPRWLEPDDVNVKLSAAWLIERSGIRRGFSLPGSGAAISSKHTLAITNRGHATAADVAELARYVKARVRSEFGIHLHAEPVAVNVEL